MPTKGRRKPKRKAKAPISAKTRARDDELRARLRNFDVKILDRALEKAIKSPTQ